ncbi:MAG: hypothetical protein IKK58_05600 [Clostridia bacterium]|nr:hypothetical protein [Clostridia bacterium]
MKKSLGITLSSISTFIFSVPLVVSIMSMADMIRSINSYGPTYIDLEWRFFISVFAIWSIAIAGSVVLYKVSKTPAITAVTASLTACAASIFAGLGLHYIIMMIL